MIELKHREHFWAVNTDHTRLCFPRKDDRWGHLLVIGLGGRRRAFTDSAEQDEEGQDPASIRPVFQEIHAQTSEAGVTFLLVGRHGPVHFSASFVVSEWSSPTDCGTTVQADIAARCRQPGLAFASAYRVYQRGCSIETADSRRVRWRGGPGEPGVSLGAGFPAPDARESGASRLTIRDDTVVEPGRTDWLVGIEPEVDPAQLTQRWAYYWEFSTPSKTATAGVP